MRVLPVRDALHSNREMRRRGVELATRYLTERQVLSLLHDETIPAADRIAILHHRFFDFTIAQQLGLVLVPSLARFALEWLVATDKEQATRCYRILQRIPDEMRDEFVGRVRAVFSSEQLREIATQYPSPRIIAVFLDSGDFEACDVRCVLQSYLRDSNANRGDPTRQALERTEKFLENPSDLPFVTPTAVCAEGYGEQCARL